MGELKLTWKLYSAYGKDQILRLVVDLNKGMIYPVSPDKEHVDFIAEDILGTTRKELGKHLEWADKMISCVIAVDESGRNVSGILTGSSSSERYGVTHYKEDLETAHAIFLRFIDEGDIPRAEGFDQKISYKYVKKKMAA